MPGTKKMLQQTGWMNGSYTWSGWIYPSYFHKDHLCIHQCALDCKEQKLSNGLIKCEFIFLSL